MRRIKKYVFPTVTVLVFWYISFIFAIGGVIGYIATYFFETKLTNNKQLRRIHIIYFPISKEWGIHFHHWMMGIVLVLFSWPIGVLAVTPEVIIGMAGGLIFHDLYIDKDWNKIFLKKQDGLSLLRITGYKDN